MENAYEETHSNKNSLSTSSEESAGLTFGLLRHPLEDVQAKKKHPWTTTQQSSLLQKSAKTSLERTSDYLIKKLFPYLDQHWLHLWRHTFCNVTCHASVRVLQTAIYNLNFIVLMCCYSFRAEFHKIGSRQHQVFYYWWVHFFFK